MEQLDYLPLGPRRGLAIIQVLDKTLVVSVSDQRIELLVELEGDGARIAAEGFGPGPRSPAAPTLPQLARTLIRQWSRSRSGSGPS